MAPRLYGLCLSGTRRRQRSRADFRELLFPRLVTAAAGDVGVCPAETMSWHGLARPSHSRGLGGVVLETEVLVCGPSTGPRSSVKVVSGSLLSTGRESARPPAPSTAVTPPLVHSVHKSRRAAAGPAGSSVSRGWEVGPRGPQAEVVRSRGGSCWAVARAGRRKRSPCQAWCPPLWSTAVLHGPCRRTRGAASGRTRRVRA